MLLQWALPPVWVDVSEGIASDIQCSGVKIVALIKAHAKALVPSLGDGREDQYIVEAPSQVISHLLRSERRLQKLSASGLFEDSTMGKTVRDFSEHQMAKLKTS